MGNERYLVLVHFASRLTRDNLTSIATCVVKAVRENLENTEAVMTSDTAVAMIGNSAADPKSLFREIGTCMRSGDNLSILSIGDNVITSHPGLANWRNAKTAKHDSL